MHYLSKFLILLLVFSFTGCAKEEVEEDNTEYEYIEPCNDTHLFSYLNSEAKEQLFMANTGEEMSDEQLKLLNQNLSSMTLTDIYGSEVVLSDYDDCNLVFEIVSVFCNHCKLQVTQYNPTIFENHPELTFIQFFAIGSNEEVFNFYKENSTEINENTIVLSANEDLLDYVLEIGVGYTPTILCFDEGKCTWAAEGVVSPSEFNRFYDIAYNEAFDFSNLTDEEGNSIFSGRRSKEDVKDDLSDYNVASLQLLDNDMVTEDLTYSLIGQNCDYTDLYTAELNSAPSMDYEGYETKNVALLYVYMTGLENTDKECLNLINRLIQKNSDLSFITMIIEEDVSSYAQYLQYGITLNCPVISSDSSMPKDFSKIGAYNYPSVIFIEKGTMTGAYSSFSSMDDFAKAKELFIGEKSIAHVNNNYSE